MVARPHRRMEWDKFHRAHLNEKRWIFQRIVPKSRGATVSRTVHESNVFIPFGLLLSEKQIPRFVGNVEVINGVVGVELCAPKAGALLP